MAAVAAAAAGLASSAALGASAAEMPLAAGAEGLVSEVLPAGSGCLLLGWASSGLAATAAGSSLDVFEDFAAVVASSFAGSLLVAAAVAFAIGAASGAFSADAS